MAISSVRQGSNDLTDDSRAKFTPASKFGEVGAGTGSSSVSTLQNAYDNSVDPEITLNSTNGGLSVRDNVAPIGAAILEVQNAGGTSTFFKADVSGITVDGTINIGGGTPAISLSGDAVTVTKAFHRIDTEGAAASDDLSTINGGTAGDRVIFGIVASGRDITAKDGVGNMKLAGDFLMDNPNKTIELLFDGSTWIELSRSSNSS